MKKPISPQAFFEEMVAGYQNNAETNDAIYEKLSNQTWANKVLASHRLFIEKNKLGFGDAAFHSMWALLFEAAAARHKRVRALEIGVFKGQIISLWALLAKSYQRPVEIFAISPLKGTPLPKSKILHRINKIFSKKYRERLKNSDFYDEENYKEIIKNLFLKFNLNFDHVRLFEGFSSDKKILEKTKDLQFEIVYVDGDHTYNGATQDFEKFGKQVVKGGWLVADDAGCALPGTKFWKGHEAVSKAVEILPRLGFKNVLNVGHNRVFEKVIGS